MRNLAFGDLAQLVRASRLHREGRGSESLSPHQFTIPKGRSSLLSFLVSTPSVQKIPDLSGLFLLSSFPKTSPEWDEVGGVS